ncbi:MAG: hypothetical protein GXO77_09305 [Calditrichaeota bacterium]|nr:hypothetical protein [Calditrichota bacterium]
MAFFRFGFLILLSNIIVLILSGCDAPRNNPLDASNPHRKFANVEGRVFTFSLPFKTLNQTEVKFDAAERMCRTDQNGYFSMENVKKVDGWLFFRKEGYHYDSLYIDWRGKTNWYGEIHLNALPTLDSLIFYSSIINRYPNIQILEVYVRARISDSDNDIDSVFFRSPSLDFSTLLTFDTIEKFYEKSRITLSQLKLNSAEELIGNVFNIIVKDAYKHSVNICQAQIRRIIRDEVQLKSPASHEVVNSTPTLRWEPINPGYAFTYTVEIRTDEADPQLIWQKEGLPATASSVEVDAPLPTQPISNYIWAVWVIDNFGNRARSKFKSFQVQ